MDSNTYIQAIQDFFLFRFSQPPYFLLGIGLLISLSCALPFALMLRQLMQYWSTNHSPKAFTTWKKLQLVIPWFGTLAGVCITFASTFEILGLTTATSYFVALVLTSVIGLFVWSQISRLLSRNLLRSYLSEFPELFPQR
jgi:hypothetical protein